MPEIAPLRGVRFDPRALPPVRGICPPYDVIRPEDHRALLDYHPRNAVRWILGTDPAQPAGDSAEYRRRGAEIRQWLGEGVLVRDTEPSLYIYELHSAEPTGPPPYRALLCALEAAPWTERRVRPHEMVREGVVSDRYELLKESGIDSGVVSAVVDGRGWFSDLLQSCEGERLFEGSGWDRAGHCLSRVRAPGAIDKVCAALRDRDAVVADGHHRYTTLIEWGRELRARHPERGDRHARVLAAVGDLFEPGLVIRPTHRLLVWPADAAGAAERAAREIAERLGDQRGIDWGAELAGRRPFHMRSVDQSAAKTLAARLAELVAGFEIPPEVMTFHDVGVARQRLRALGPRAVLVRMPPVGKEEFWRRAGAGEVFPPKTTYFVPKIPTGVVARLLEEEME